MVITIIIRSVFTFYRQQQLSVTRALLAQGQHWIEPFREEGSNGPFHCRRKLVDSDSLRRWLEGLGRPEKLKG